MTLMRKRSLRINNPALVLGSLKPSDADLMKKYPVSTRINHPENDDYECAQENFRRSHSNTVPIPQVSIKAAVQPQQSGLFFHNSIHRYFVFTLRIALTSIKQLFSFACVDG
jgi:hypothetical protein